MRIRGRRTPPPWGAPDEYATLCRARLDHLVPVREPLALVSQVQRSGGTLLSQLFDGHPECHAHPSEIYIGHPKKWNWPDLDLSDSSGWFATLYERPVELHLEEGYVKEKETRNEPGHEVYPFVFIPHLQRRIFEMCVDAWAPASEREVLDCYFTSYFNAWLDDQNLYSGPKRAVTGFTPRLAMEGDNAARFFSAYPDGTLISIVRDPRGWYASASTYRSGLYEDPEQAIGLWARSVEAALDARARFGERVLVLTYEHLVVETERVMRLVADRLGIAMAPGLLVPTFNGQPVRANSSTRIAGHGVIADRAEGFRHALDAATVARIGELSGDLYARAATLSSSG